MGRIFLLILIYISAPLIAYGQSHHQANFTMYNGLPSDHVYYILKDSYGYLWMGTTQGVVKYNGYSFKVYDQSDGLPNSDVWYLFEDRKKRMWLSSISSDFGYIYNGKYNKSYIQDTDARILPVYITNTNSGIIFCNLCRKVDVNSQLCLEKNDTLYDLSIPGFQKGNFYINSRGQVYVMTYGTDDICKVTFHGLNYSIVKTNVHVAGFSANPRATEYLFGNYFLVYDKPILLEPQYYNEYINVYNLRTGKHDSLRLVKGGQEHITLLEEIDHALNIVTDKNIYRYDSLLRLLDVIPTRSLIDNEQVARNVTNLVNDPFWGKCVATATHGAYIDLGQQNNFSKTDHSLLGYVFAGYSADHQNFWWNKEEHKLISIDSSWKIKTQVFNEFSTVKVIAYDSERSLLLSNTNTYWYYNTTKKLKWFFDGTTTISSDKPINHNGEFGGDFINAKNAIHINNDFIFCYVNNIVKFSFTGHKVDIKFIDEYKYKKIVYDSVRNLLFAYNENKICIYNVKTGAKNYVTRKALDVLHIDKVEQLFFDNKHGNIFLKDYNHFFVFNYNKFQFKELYTNYTLVNSTFYLLNDLIIASGKFGLFFSKIDGFAKVTEPILYRNVKNELYQYVRDMAISSNEVVLNTDKGVYTVPIPTVFNACISSGPGKFRLILNYQDSLSVINTGDTINIKQFATSLGFDVVNPLGSGTPKYTYRFGAKNAELQILTGNALTLPKVTPGNYYTLYMNVSDDAWKSKTLVLHIYIQPYWWQSSLGKKVILFSIVILLTLIVISAIYITRTIEERKNRKKSLQLGLELKAVYAQLNPHFIFNSLNLTLYLISKNKLDDAYTHVLKFSGLLRAYLKSCRNRFITIADETTNIGNYIQLQQMRFDNLFTYEIIIDPQLSPVATKIPALILQPIVENAINHGLLPKGKGGHLVIEFIKQENNAITINVDDNGIGRKQAGEFSVPELKKTESYGSGLTDELIDIFNRYENAGIELNYIDKEFPLTGTKVQIEIKNPNYNAR